MKAYEGIFIFDPNLKKEDLDSLISEIESDIVKNHGKVEETVRMGRRRLESKIGRNIDGFFLMINLFANGETMNKINPKLRMNESILRYAFIDRDKKGFSKIKSFEEDRGEKVFEDRGVSQV